MRHTDYLLDQTQAQDHIPVASAKTLFPEVIFSSDTSLSVR